MSNDIPALQYAYRSLKSFDSAYGPPQYERVNGFPKLDATVKTFEYSSDGRLLAVGLPNEVQVYDNATSLLVATIPILSAIDLNLSPSGSFIAIWQRYNKPADGEETPRNLTIWEVQSTKQLTSFTQKSFENWRLQFTQDELKALRLVTNEIQIFNCQDFASGPVERCRLEGVSSFLLSKDSQPKIALFVAEKKGSPASIQIYALSALSAPSSKKSFFKADKIQMKWNNDGSSLLALTQTEVDKTGKSYYGESNLYLMHADGKFDCRVHLDKEGGVHDFEWSPSSKEFVVNYGYMPSKTVLMDKKSNIVLELGTLPRNFVSFNPQGRLLCIAGFGNLAGQIDIWDLKSKQKHSSFNAPNSSQCDWSPDGRYLMCCTLSPRLRVDNGVRIFHYSGQLMHVDSMEELYQVQWRPQTSKSFPPLEAILPPAPAPSPTAAQLPATPSKSLTGSGGGAYRPPHLRGSATPDIFKREDEGGRPYTPPNSLSNGSLDKLSSRRSHNIPGTAKPTSSNEEKKDKKGKKPPATKPIVETLEIAEESSLSPADKKKRALMKKLTAIDALKSRAANGEQLELNQLKKIESEKELRKELQALG